MRGLPAHLRAMGALVRWGVAPTTDTDVAVAHHQLDS